MIISMLCISAEHYQARALLMLFGGQSARLKPASVGRLGLERR